MFDDRVERKSPAGEIADTGIGLAQAVSPKTEIITDGEVRKCDGRHSVLGKALTAKNAKKGQKGAKKNAHHRDTEDTEREGERETDCTR